MDKFVKKVSKQFQVAVNSTKEVFGKSQIVEDEEYTKLSKDLVDYKAGLKTLISHITEFSDSMYEFSHSLTVASGAFKDFVSESSSCHRNASNGAKVSSSIERNATNFRDTYLEAQVLNPIRKKLEEIKEVRTLEEKRKKNHVLLYNAVKNLESSEKKDDSKSIEEYTQAVKHRREKFELYNSQFRHGARSLLDGKATCIETYYNTFQYYVNGYFNSANEMISSELTDFPTTSVAETNPSITKVPESEQPKSANQ